MENPEEPDKPLMPNELCDYIDGVLKELVGIGPEISDLEIKISKIEGDIDTTLIVDLETLEFKQDFLISKNKENFKNIFIQYEEDFIYYIFGAVKRYRRMDHDEIIALSEKANSIIKILDGEDEIIDKIIDALDRNIKYSNDAEDDF